ncbi:MAG TPA: NADH-quinone oxidoreductase subunit N [Candidatus Acidoferrum sp.]|nr:NADH-quinone oxidoreductase subunit N [Candidatus Acidoferrum sp.]
MNYFEVLRAAAPETVLAITVLFVLAADLIVLRGATVRGRFLMGGMLVVVGCLLAAVFTWLRFGQPDPLHGMLIVDPRTDFLKDVLLALTVFTVLISTAGRFTEHVGEYLALVLLGTIGLMLLVSAEDLLMIFIALELASLSLYILTAFNKRNARSSEAALKYFLFGGMSAAFLLFGFSLLYGLSGSTHLQEIAGGLAGKGADPLLYVAIVMTVVGFGFKVAAVPFHLWAPDAYEGAPTPSAAFIATGSKVASFYLLVKILAVGFAGAAGSAAWKNGVPGWVPVIAVVAILSMLLGNLTAIVQTSVKRLLAYSAIAHAGYMLLGVLANTPSGQSALLFYVITYALTVLGAFGVVTVVEEATGGDAIKDFAGLSRRAPLLSLCLLVFLLSLAGIPPLAGFIGKFFLFSATVAADEQNLGLLWLVVLAIVMSAVSFYYYLQVLKQAYVVDAPEDVPAIRVPLILRLTLLVLAGLVVLLGCAPGLLLNQL